MTKLVSSDIPVKAWMSPTVRSVHLQATVRDVLEIMKQEKLSSTPVVDSNGHVVGIVTLGDVARVVLSTDQLLESDFPRFQDCLWAVDVIQQRLGSDKVTALMSENVASIHPDQSMFEAAKLMSDASIRHLAVVCDEQLVGMLSANDFVRLVASDTAISPAV